MILTNTAESEGKALLLGPPQEGHGTKADQGMSTEAELMPGSTQGTEGLINKTEVPAFLDEPHVKESKKVPGARRKPEKSRIVRVCQSEENKDLSCPKCFSEVLSEEDLERHILTCRRSTSPMSQSGENPLDPFSKYRVGSSPELSENSGIKENNGLSSGQQESPGNPEGYSNVLKMLRQAVPQMSNQQQLALEVLLNAQMSLSRMNERQEEGSSGEGRPNNLSLQQQQLLQLQLIQLLQAQLTVNNDKSPEPNGRRAKEVEDEDFSHPFMRRRSPFCPEPNDILRKDLLQEKRRMSFSEDTPLNPVSPPSSSKNISSLVIQHPDSPPAGVPNTLEMLQKTADDVLNNASKSLLSSRLIDSCREAETSDPNRRHRCRYCGKVFSSDSGLQIHIRSHTGERPFKCNVCGNRFTTKGNLKVHFQRHSDQFPNLKMNPHPVPEHLDKFYPPLLPPSSEGINEPPTSLPTSSPSSIPLSPLTTSPPFKPMGLRPPPPLGMNLKSIGENFLRPPTSESLGKDFQRNFLDLRLFPPFLVPPQSLSHRMSEESKFDNKENSDTEEPPKSISPRKEKEINAKEIKMEARDDEEPMSSPSHMDQDEESNTTYQDSIKDVQKLLTPTNQALDILKRDFMGPGLTESKNLYKDITSSEMSEDSHQPLNLQNSSEKFERESSMDENDRLQEDEHKNDREEQDAYLSDSSMGATEKRSKQGSPSIGSPVEFSHLPFLGMPLPPNLSLLQGLHLPFPPTSQSFIHHSLDPSKVPQIYNNLLPRPGSTDNSWEALIEVKKTDEQSKIEQLIDKSREIKATEPNQCAICQRVLSCKSALQMHYRIHTGERPFKCKICSRSFTTKGNLKTHMSVHRAKPPMRMLQQCPICHKKFSNALILQQHIRLHTGEPTDLSPEQIYAAEVRDFPIMQDFPMPMRFPMGPGGLPPHLQPRGPFPHQHLPLPFYSPPKPPRKEDADGKFGSPFSSSPRSSSTSSAEQHSAEDLSMRMREDDGETAQSRPFMVSPTLSDYSDAEDKHPNGAVKESRESPSKDSSGLASESALHENPFHHAMGLGGFPLTKEHAGKPFPFFPQLGLLSSLKQNGYPMLNLPGMPPFEGNTTCKVCFKVFACQSALEIHLRSHTKERPFKCSYCDRGFSTKGNMKQHVATHRNADGTCRSTSPSPSSEGSYNGELPASENEIKEEDKMDSGMKREREGELSLPDAKRALGGLESDGVSSNDESAPPSERRSPMEISPTYFPPTSIPFPASLGIPSSFPFISRSSHHPMSLPLCLPLSLPTPLPIPKSDSLQS